MSPVSPGPVSGAGERVVVGVDTSSGARAALAWAAGYARETGAHLDLAHVHDPETDELHGGVYPSHDALVRLEAHDEQVLDAAEAQLPADVARERHVLHGGAGGALVAHSSDADLLVVGGTAHRAVVRALLGSTAEHCVRRAPCPVVVVPARHEPQQHRRRPTLGARQR